MLDIGWTELLVVAIVAISSNDVSSHPEDSPEQMVHEAEQRGYSFPYLFDEDQAVAKDYRAACTPDFFIFRIFFVKFKRLSDAIS